MWIITTISGRKYIARGLIAIILMAFVAYGIGALIRGLFHFWKDDMRTYEVTYRLRGVTKMDSFSVRTNTDALLKLIAKLSRRDRLFFKLIKVSVI